MKNISKFFAAFATIALCASCGSEDILDNTEGNVPAGMHEVCLTINTNKSRVAINDASGDLTWEAGDVINVKYTDGNNYEFRITGSAGSPNATFKGTIPEDVYGNHAPQYVYYYGNPDSQDLSVQNNFVANSKGTYSFKGYNVTLGGEALCAGANACVDNFSAYISTRGACMLRVAKQDYTIKTEDVGGKTNNYVEVALSYIPGYGNRVSESYRINNIKVDAEGKPVEDLTFFATNETLSSGNYLYLIQAYINGDTGNPFHTHFNENNLNDGIVGPVEPDGRHILKPYTWVMIHNASVNLFEVIQCDNDMTWQQYAVTNSKVKIDGDKVGYEFGGTTYQMFNDETFWNPVKPTDKVSVFDGSTIKIQLSMY